MTFILVYGKIFEDIRPEKDYTKKWNTLFHCPLCVGFWVGVFMWAINGFTELFTFEYSLINALICGCISSLLFRFLTRAERDRFLFIGDLKT